MTDPFRGSDAPQNTFDQTTEYQTGPSSHGLPAEDQSTKEAVAHAAKDEAGAVKDTAVEAGKSVAQTAMSEAGDVAAHAKDQLRSLTSTAREELRGRAWDTHSFATSNVRSMSDELRQLLNGETTDGPGNQLAQTLSSKGESLAGWLEQHDPEDLMDEVRRFAARRPVAFLALAAGAGLVAGRLARGVKDAEAERTAAKDFYAQRRTTLSSSSTAPAYPVQPAVGEGLGSQQAGTGLSGELR